MEKRNRRQFTHEFKEQIVLLYRNDKSKADILREYDLYPSTLGKWIKQYETTQSFLEADNRTPEQKRIVEKIEEMLPHTKQLVKE